MALIAAFALIYIALFVTSPLIALFHELGHALAYLAFTKPNTIDIYIGSYGDPKNFCSFRLGKLKFNIKYSFPFVKGIGLCRSDVTEIDAIKYIFILLAGPFFSFFAAILIGYLVFYYNLPDLVRVYFGALILFSGLSLIINLFPRDITTADPNGLSSDGAQIAFVLKYRKFYPEFIAIIEEINKTNFEEALKRLDLLSQANGSHYRILRLQATCLTYLKRYDEAVICLNKLSAHVRLSSGELITLGYVHSMKQEHIEAQAKYFEALRRVPNDIIALNNMGYEMIETGEYKKAEAMLKKAIHLNRMFSHPNSNLGYLKLLTGKNEEAKILLDKARELDPEEAHNYKYLAMYYLNTGQTGLAKENFEICAKLDGTIDLKIIRDQFDKETADNILVNN